MIYKQTIALLGTAMLFSSSPAWTQEQADEDPTTATIRLMSNAEAELPDAVIKTIKLPDSLAVNSKAVENARGLATANQNRLVGNKGLEQAEEARQRNSDMAESAQETRENQGRSDDHRPEPPDRPGPGSQ